MVSRKLAPMALVALLAGGLLAGCGSSGADGVSASGESRYAAALKDATAYGRAKAYRIQIEAHTTSSEGVDSVDVLRTAALKLPATTFVAGIRDANHDGLDDDRQVEVTVQDSTAAACVHLPEKGVDVTVTKGGC